MPDIPALVTAAAADVPAEHRQEAAELWQDLGNLLTTLAEVAFQIDNPGSLDTQREIQKYDAASLKAVGAASNELLDLLFNRPLPIAIERDTTEKSYISSRPLVQFFPAAALRELAVYLRVAVSERLSVPHNERSKTSGWELQAAHFLAQWLKDAAQQAPLDPLNRAVSDASVTRAAAGLYVNPIPESTALTVAFDTWTDQFEQIRRNLRDALELAPVVGRVMAAADRVESAADSAEGTAGHIGADELAKHFDALARAERRRAAFWAARSVVAVIATAVIAALTLGYWVPVDRGWAAQLVHLAVTLPLAAVAAYASRISSGHRQQAWWSDTTAAQLHTITAFSSPLNEETKSRLRENFGMRIFTNTIMNTAQPDPNSAAVTTTLSELLSAIHRPEKGG